MHKIIAIILLVIAAAGLVYDILGVPQKTLKVKSGDIKGVYNFAKNSYDGTMTCLSAGGLSSGLENVRKLARSQRSRQM